MAAAAASSKTASPTIAALNLATPFSGASFRSSGKAYKGRAASLKVNCMQVWPPYNNKKWETLSYLPPLTSEQILKQVDYLLQNKWVPCIEFDEDAEIKRKYGTTPGYYDGRYWIMWKLPMFGCNDASQVMREINECAKAYPKAFIRVIGFDSVRQVQCISFIVQKPS
ncbi:TPA: ribulose bisphosphate carboxylase small subunit [Clostridioides difficile]|nr:ribulose bisphosphate carboxylase small subunit [Clostridioides difficile]